MATPALTRVLEAAIEQHQPPLVRGRRIKLRYAHQGGKNPPIIVIHGNQVEDVPGSYRRYLENFFRAELDPARLAELDERLSAWMGLARRFRRPPEGGFEVSIHIPMRPTPAAATAVA